MTDLVKRLRAEAEGMPATYIKHQAADEIERLRRNNADYHAYMMERHNEALALRSRLQHALAALRCIENTPPTEFAYRTQPWWIQLVSSMKEQASEALRVVEGKRPRARGCPSVGCQMPAGHEEPCSPPLVSADEGQEICGHLMGHADGFPIRCIKYANHAGGHVATATLSEYEPLPAEAGREACQICGGLRYLDMDGEDPCPSCNTGLAPPELRAVLSNALDEHRNAIMKSFQTGKPVRDFYDLCSSGVEHREDAINAAVHRSAPVTEGVGSSPTTDQSTAATGQVIKSDNLPAERPEAGQEPGKVYDSDLAIAPNQVTDAERQPSSYQQTLKCEHDGCAMTIKATADLAFEMLGPWYCPDHQPGPRGTLRFVERNGT